MRYDLPRPTLTSEQSFVGGASFDWRGLYWRWGDGLYWQRTIRGANVIAHGGFLGKVAWVKKIWTARTETDGAGPRVAQLDSTAQDRASRPGPPARDAARQGD